MNSLRYVIQKADFKFYILVVSWLFVNSLIIGLIGVPAQLLYFTMIFIYKAQKGHLFYFRIMILSMLLSDIFEYDIAFVSFSDGVCATTCMDLFNVSFLMFWISLFVKKKLFNTFSSIGAIGGLFIILISWIIISTSLTSYGYFEVLSNTGRFILFFLFFVVSVFSMTSINGIKIVISCLFLFVITGCVLGVVPFILGQPKTTFAASILIFAIPIVGGILVQYIRNDGFKKQGLAVFLLLLSLLPLILSDSRRNLTMILLFLVYLAYSLKIYKKPLVLICSIGLISLLSTEVLSENFKNRIDTSLTALGQIYNEGKVEDDLSTDFYTGRDVIFQKTILGIEENFLTGIGLEKSYNYLEESIGEKVRPHNFFFQFAIETGLLGLILYFLITIIFIFSLVRSKRLFRRSNNRFSHTCIGIINGLFVFLVIAHILAFFGLYMLYDKFYWFMFSFAPALSKLVRKVTIVPTFNINSFG